MYIGTRLSTYFLITSPASFHITVSASKSLRPDSDLPFQRSRDQALLTSPLPFLSFLRLLRCDRDQRAGVSYPSTFISPGITSSRKPTLPPCPSPSSCAPRHRGIFHSVFSLINGRQYTAVLKGRGSGIRYTRV